MYVFSFSFSEFMVSHSCACTKVVIYHCVIDSSMINMIYKVALGRSTVVYRQYFCCQRYRTYKGIVRRSIYIYIYIVNTRTIILRNLKY